MLQIFCRRRLGVVAFGDVVVDASEPKDRSLFSRFRSMPFSSPTPVGNAEAVKLQTYLVFIASKTIFDDDEGALEPITARKNGLRCFWSLSYKRSMFLGKARYRDLSLHYHWPSRCTLHGVECELVIGDYRLFNCN